MTTYSKIIPTHLVPHFRSNHAGETGAVFIYKAILKFSKDKDVLSFAKKHLKTEQSHLKKINKVFDKKDNSKLIILWKIFGYITGLIPSLVGKNFIFTTIYFVEKFVEKHYLEQIKILENDKEHLHLYKLIKNLMNDEIDHKNEAYEKFNDFSVLTKFWGNIIMQGSSLAVNISKRF